MCCTSTKAMPVSSRNARSNSVNASNPPADAPTPTIGNGLLGLSSDSTEAAVCSLASTCASAAPVSDGTAAICSSAAASGSAPFPSPSPDRSTSRPGGGFSLAMLGFQGFISSSWKGDGLLRTTRSYRRGNEGSSECNPSRDSNGASTKPALRESSHQAIRLVSVRLRSIAGEGHEIKRTVLRLRWLGAIAIFARFQAWMVAPLLSRLGLAFQHCAIFRCRMSRRCCRGCPRLSSLP
jgi:hypothetical protein